MIQNEDDGQCQRRRSSVASVHILGLLIVAGTLITMLDQLSATDSRLVELGLIWQHRILGWGFYICVLACLIFLLAPLIIRRPQGAFRILIGMPVLFRYIVAATAFVVTMLAIEHVLFWPVGVITIPSTINDAQRDMITRETRPNVILRGNQILFLEDKRATVENAIQSRSMPRTEKRKQERLGTD